MRRIDGYIQEAESGLTRLGTKVYRACAGVLSLIGIIVGYAHVLWRFGVLQRAGRGISVADWRFALLFLCELACLYLVYALCPYLARLAVLCLVRGLRRLRSLLPGCAQNAASDGFVANVGRELADRREECAKVFSLGGGLRQAVIYPMPLHVRGARGSWQEIDNTLSLCEVGNVFTHRNTGNPFEVTLPDLLTTGAGICVRYGGAELRWRLDGALRGAGAIVEQGKALYEKRAAGMTEQEKRAAAIWYGSRLTYDCVREGLSLRYVLDGLAVQEQLIAANWAALEDLAMQLDARYAYRLDEERGLLACSPESGEAIFRFALQPAWDAGCQARACVAAMLLDEQPPAAARLRFAFADEHLARATFPLTLAISVTPCRARANIVDTYLSQSAQDANFEASDILRCGGNAASGDDVALIRSDTWVKPEADEAVVRAELRLTMGAHPGAGGTYEARALKAAVNMSTATWNGVIGARGAYIADEVQGKATCDTGPYMTFDITGLYRAWFEAEPSVANQNHGLALTRSANLGAIGDYSELAAANAGGLRAPRLIVNYARRAPARGRCALRRHDVRGALGLGGKRAKERVHIAFAREAFGFLLELRYQHRHEAYGYEDVDVFECACAEDAWRVWRIAMTYDQRYEWLDLNIRLRGRTSLVVTEGKAGIARDAYEGLEDFLGGSHEIRERYRAKKRYRGEALKRELYEECARFLRRNSALLARGQTP